MKQNLRQVRYLGQSLVEAVVTLGIVLLMLSGLVIITLSSLHNAQASKNRAIASQFGQESLEIARRERDSGWSAFIVKDGKKYCVGGQGTLSVTTDISSCPEVGSGFRRTLDFTYTPLTLTMNVASSVSWKEGETTKTASFVTIFTQWK